MRCGTRPVGTVDVIGRGWLRCSTWTIGVRSLLRFASFAPGTPSASRGPHGFKARRGDGENPKTQGYQIPLSFGYFPAAPAGLEPSRLRHPKVVCARETRHKPRHVYAGGATGGPWRGLLRVSRGSASGRRRRRRARMYSTAAPGGPPGVRGVPPGLLLGTTKMVAWRDKVRFLAVAEKHVVRGFCANKKFSVPLVGSETARRWSFYGLVFYVHELVQGMTRSPLFFRGPRNTQKWSKQPP